MTPEQLAELEKDLRAALEDGARLAESSDVIDTVDTDVYMSAKIILELIDAYKERDELRRLLKMALPVLEAETMAVPECGWDEFWAECEKVLGR